MRVELQLVLHIGREAVMAAPEVDRPGGDRHPHRLGGDDHRAAPTRLPRAARSPVRLDLDRPLRQDRGRRAGVLDQQPCEGRLLLGRQREPTLPRLPAPGRHLLRRDAVPSGDLDPPAFQSQTIPPRSAP
jgi:hypothetical protein